MIKIAICDDDRKELDKTEKMCSDFSAAHKEFELKIKTYASPEELISDINQQGSYDIILLDIYMPNITGTQLARSLREKNDNCQIVFLTTSTAHAVEAFSLHAAHYLVKPYTGMQFNDALSKAISTLENNKLTLITLKTSGGVQKLNPKDIYYSVTEGHIQNIFFQEGKCMKVRITSTELFNLLSKDKRFFKCGSTYIINLDKIDEVSARYILFENGDQIPMLRRQYKELLDRYTRYCVEAY